MRKWGMCSKGENKIKPLGVEGCNSKMEISNLLDKEFKAMVIKCSLNWGGQGRNTVRNSTMRQKI